MKRALFTILAAAVCGSMTASAVDANAVKVTLNVKGGATKVEKLAPPQGMSFAGASMSAQPVVNWQLVNIPVKVEAKAKGDEPAQFVPAIKFTAHLLFESDNNDGKPVKLSKEITYVDIPVSGGGEAAKNEISLGVFIPPSSATRINVKGKGDLKGKLMGIALEAEFNNKQCMKTGEPRFVIFDNNAKKKLTDEWWTKNMGETGAVACSIDQTPYAAWAGTAYPQIAPATEDAATSPVPAFPTPSTDTTDTGSTDTDTPAATDTTATDTEATEEEDSGKSKKGKKKTKRSRR